MTDFETNVRMQVYVWLGVDDLWSYGESAIQEYWEDYFESCEMKTPETGMEVF